MVDTGLTKDEKETPSLGTPKIISQYAGAPVEWFGQVLLVNEAEPKKIRMLTNIMAFLSGSG